MLQGTFRELSPRVALLLPGREQVLIRVEFVVDTGFDGYLTLPAEIAQKVALVEAGPETQILADGSRVAFPVGYISYEDEDGDRRRVEVLVMGSNPLLGTRFLLNGQLSIALHEGGAVLWERD